MTEPKKKKPKKKVAKLPELKHTVWMIRDSVSGLYLKMGQGSRYISFTRKGTVFQTEEHLLKAVARVKAQQNIYSGYRVGAPNVQQSDIQVIPYTLAVDCMIPAMVYGE
jgi:hypothetical protein